MPTLKPLWLHLESLAERLGQSQAVCLGTDYDGTLAQIVSHPELARLESRPHAAMRALVEAPGVHVAVVSGRRLEDLRPRLDLPGAYLVGVGGLEAEDESGRSIQVFPLDPALPDDVRAGLEDWCKGFPGAWIEAKGPALAIHYRAVPDRNQPAFCAGVRRRLAPFRRSSRILHGKKVYEVLPPGAPDKAAALKAWLERHEPHGLLFYFGDDANDEPVHAMVRALGGIAVAVARTASRAEYALASPAEVTWFLEWLKREWSYVLGARSGG
jgi:trehalose 6-phosphate phosphatase